MKAMIGMLAEVMVVSVLGGFELRLVIMSAGWSESMDLVDILRFRDISGIALTLGVREAILCLMTDLRRLRVISSLSILLSNDMTSEALATAMAVFATLAISIGRRVAGAADVIVCVRLLSELAIVDRVVL